jgi:hypothetical protein
MKTIFLTIGRGMVARNLLQNDFFLKLREKFQLVILTPAANDERFRKEFGHPNVSFYYFSEARHTSADIIFLGLHKYLLWSKYVALKLRYGIRALSRPEDLSLVRFYLFAAIFIPLSKIVWVKDLLRLIDFYFGQRQKVRFWRTLIHQYHPALVVVTSISSNTEAALVKAARREKIKTIGMPKSWDNLSRAGFRAQSDILVVWNQFMADQAVTFQRYRPEQVRIIGIPQFDCYLDARRLWSRERFGREFGIDPMRQLILLTSEGKSVPEDTDIALLVAEFIKQNQLPNAALIIRPHFSYRGDEQKFNLVANQPQVAIDRLNVSSQGFKDYGDYSLVAIERFVNTIAHADVVVNVASTITLDAVAFDKPIINIAFEPRITVPPQNQPLASGYESDYFLEIVKTGGTRVVKSREEFLSDLRQYLENPKLDTDGRIRLRQRFVEPFDGQAGRRFAEVVIQAAESQTQSPEQ